METADGIGLVQERAGEKSGPRGFRKSSGRPKGSGSGDVQRTRGFQDGSQALTFISEGLPVLNAAEMLRVPVGAQGSNHLLRGMKGNTQCSLPPFPLPSSSTLNLNEWLEV